jgi:hypothetical protein
MFEKGETLWGKRHSCLRPLESEKKGFMRTVSMALDLIAKRILEELSKRPLNITEIATVCTGGATRLTSPRLVWLEGLGMIEGTGAGTYAITSIGQNFLEILNWN